jgi:hypothetical protein
MRAERTVGGSVNRETVLGQRGAFGKDLSNSAYCPLPGGLFLHNSPPRNGKEFEGATPPGSKHVGAAADSPLWFRKEDGILAAGCEMKAGMKREDD